MNKTISEKRDVTNFIELRVAGLMRSGNHAVISWIMNQHAGHPACFLNNVNHGNFDPYATYVQRVMIGIDETIDIEQLRTMKKRLLIYSYEDRAEFVSRTTDFLSSVFRKDFEANRESYLQTSQYRFDVLIIRDPFNCMASRLKMLKERGAMGGINDPDLIIWNWKLFARQAIALINNPEAGKIVVSYNHWIDDVDYRQQLSSALIGNYNDSSLAELSDFGRGSSFDRSRLSINMMLRQWWKFFSLERYAKFGSYWKRFTAPTPQRMKVKERWKLFATDKTFRRLFSDEEVLRLSEILFGELPGTRKFVEEVKAEK